MPSPVTTPAEAAFATAVASEHAARLPTPRPLERNATLREAGRAFRDVLVVTACLALFAAATRAAPLDLTHTLAAPSRAHPLGTDSLGRDVLGRIGAALMGGVLPLWLAVVLGTALGIVAGASLAAAPAQRATARLVHGVAVVATTVPLFLIVFAAAAWNGAAGLAPLLAPLTLVMAARALIDVDELARRDGRLAFWEAHAALGGSRFIRIWRYGVAAAWRGRLAATLMLGLQSAVVAEASLAFLGYGRQEPQASLGNMLAAHFDLLLKGRSLLPLVLAAALALTAAAPAALVRLARLAQSRAHGPAT
jgi:peptide/nickel transport system permease protein